MQIFVQIPSGSTGIIENMRSSTMETGWNEKLPLSKSFLLWRCWMFLSFDFRSLRHLIAVLMENCLFLGVKLHPQFCEKSFCTQGSRFEFSVSMSLTWNCCIPGKCWGCKRRFLDIILRNKGKPLYSLSL